jgi:putative lipase involved disintegration of autophagic bodies
LSTPTGPSKPVGLNTLAGMTQRLDYNDGKFTLTGHDIVGVRVNSLGLFVGCTFVSFAAFDETACVEALEGK